MGAADIEVRDASAEQAGTVIRGYCALYESPAIIGGEYIEKIAPGAFAKTITNGDVLALIAHDWGRVIGRQSAGTLRLKDTPIGLHFELDADLTTPSGQEIFGNVRRRDVKGCSFGFRVLWSDWSDDDEMPLRIIREIELYEISLLANPAYEATSAWVSSRSKTNGAAAQRRIAARREAMRIRGMLVSAWQHLYSTHRWKELRRYQLASAPLCRFCLEQDIVEAATVADHVKPHKGDEALFYDKDNLQSLCKPCHDGTKQRMELGQDVVTFGADGWPR